MKMSKSETITLRVHPQLLRSARRVLHQVGVNTSDAITMFLRQVVLQKGLPFDVRIANAKARPQQRETSNPTPRPEPRIRPREEDPLEPAFEAWEKALRECEPGGRFADYKYGKAGKP
jgi:addiction module RelB/DinJ family antitoxin